MSSISTDWWIQLISIKSVFLIFIDSSIDKSIPIFIDWLLRDVYMCHAISFMSYDVSDSERFSISQEAMLVFLPRQQIFVFWLLSRIKFCFKSRRTLNVSQETWLGSFLSLDVSSNKYRKLAFFNFSLSLRYPSHPLWKGLFANRHWLFLLILFLSDKNRTLTPTSLEIDSHMKFHDRLLSIPDTCRLISTRHLSTTINFNGLSKLAVVTLGIWRW